MNSQEREVTMEGNMTRNDIDRIFNGMNNVTGAAHDISNVIVDRFCNDSNSRRNCYQQNQNQSAYMPPIQYGYGYGNNGGNYGSGMNNGVIQPCGYPGFYNPHYGATGGTW
jgi:hypothetical protein